MHEIPSTATEGDAKHIGCPPPILLGLQLRATVLVVGLIILIAAGLCGLCVRQAWYLADRLEREQSLQHARLIARLSAAPLAQQDYERLTRSLEEMVTGDPLVFVHVTDLQGNIVVDADHDLHPGDHEAKPRPDVVGVPIPSVMPDGTGLLLKVAYPIDYRDSTGSGPPRTHLLGYVHIGLNRTRTIAEFDASADLVAGIGIAIVLIAIPIGFLVVRRIVEPLNEMSRVARRFSHGDLGARSAVQRSDEIGALAESLNRMADEVARKHREIVALNEDLENRVHQRTAQLRELASREPLTGLYNRRHFGEMLGRSFSEARRYGHDLTLVMIDLDNFKDVNDRFGHQKGDEILIQTAETVAGALRAADVAARYGGDEFILLLPQTGMEQAQHVVERIADRFRAYTQQAVPEVSVGISIGMASLSVSQPRTDEDLIRAADSALYQAKTQGKDCVAWDQPPPEGPAAPSPVTPSAPGDG